MALKTRAAGLYCDWHDVLSGSAARATWLLSAVVMVIAWATCSKADEVVDDAATLSPVIVTASHLDLLGLATTASQGSVTAEELALRPAYRVGQLLESVPGLVVTAHSGEGKANQYLARGFNLDHGTDIANFLDDMPINRPTNTHGQGYSDLNFVIPELLGGLDYTKGPYYASVGDFGSVASTHLRLADEIQNQVSVTGGMYGIYNVFSGGTVHLPNTDRLVGGLYYGHLDGPFDHPDDFRKLAASLRYSHGTVQDGFGATAMFFHSEGNMTTDQPERAVQQGLIDRFGTLDPSDGNLSERYSVSAHYSHTADGWSVVASGYYIHSTMTLWNDFTHFLDDPVNGDQEAQYEARSVGGGQVAVSADQAWGPIENELRLGVQGRYDSAYVDRRHTLRRTPLGYCSVAQPVGPDLQVPRAGGICNADFVHLLDLGPYLETTTHWLPWLRTVVGLREEYYRASDSSVTTGFRGRADETLLQPKGSLIVGPFERTEIYFSAGRGFHSDDVRGVFGTVPLEGVPDGAGTTPLLAPTHGYEIGVRTTPVSPLSVQLALFQQDFASELTYNADAGQDEASAPSRRQGIELSAQYHATSWIELNTDLAWSHARYRGDLSNFGLDGAYIANAPHFIGSFGILVDNLGPWFGGLQWRKLGAYPISDGDALPQDKGYSEINVNAGFKFATRARVEVSVYNLLNQRANAAAYYYASRLPGEPAGGVNDLQVHPLEPITATLRLTVYF